MIDHQRSGSGYCGAPFIEDAGCAVRKRAVHDVRVARDPANIGGAPVHVVGLEVEDVAVRRAHAGQVAAGRVHDPLRLGGRAGGVKQVEQMLRVDRHRVELVRLAFDGLVPPVVAPRLHRDVVAGPPDDEDVPDRGRPIDRDIGGRLQVENLAIAPSPVGGDERNRLGIDHSTLERVRAEPAEHDDVRGADLGAREHRNRGARGSSACRCQPDRLSSRRASSARSRSGSPRAADPRTRGCAYRRARLPSSRRPSCRGPVRRGGRRSCTPRSAARRGTISRRAAPTRGPCPRAWPS